MGDWNLNGEYVPSAFEIPTALDRGVSPALVETVPGAAMAKIDALLEKYESFCVAVGSVDGLEVELHPVPPSTKAEIAAIERALGVTVPADLRAFWTRGFRNVAIRLGETGVAYPAFVGAKGALAQVKVALGIAKQFDDPAMQRWLLQGIPFQEEETYCFIDEAGAVRQIVFDGAATEEPIAGTFTDFFEAWLAAGCFADGCADLRVLNAYWRKVSPVVPLAIPLEHNAWLAHLGRFHEKPQFFGKKKKEKKPAAKARGASKSDEARRSASDRAFDKAEALETLVDEAGEDATTAMLDDAIGAYEAALEIAFPPWRIKAGRLSLAEILQAGDRYEAMLEVTTRLVGEEALVGDPDEVIAWRLHATALQHLGKLDLALAAANKSIGVAPRNAHALYERACVLTALGEVDKAIKDVAMAIEIDPDLAGPIADDDDLTALRTKASFKRLVETR